MRVKNRKCIRRLSFKSLWASRKRNIIAICAIALTTLMFTSLFTIMLSVNSSYETYNFRQAGGYSDGSFKDLSREQADKRKDWLSDKNSSIKQNTRKYQLQQKLAVNDADQSIIEAKKKTERKQTEKEVREEERKKGIVNFKN